MVIGQVLGYRFFLRAAFVFVLFTFTVFPLSATAHEGMEPASLPSVNMVLFDTNFSDKPYPASRHCHSISGQDCSTQDSFVHPVEVSAPDTGINLPFNLSDMLNTGWTLAFDPPPPRVLS